MRRSPGASSPPFLAGAPLAPYFERNPDLWRDIFTPRCAIPPEFLSYETRIALIQHVRFYRYLALKRYRHLWENRLCVPVFIWDFLQEGRNIRATRRFLQQTQRRTGVCVLLTPESAKIHFENYYGGLNVPVLKLRAEGLPPEYQDVHPPAYVLTWYGREIAKLLREAKLVPASRP